MSLKGFFKKRLVKARKPNTKYQTQDTSYGDAQCEILDWFFEYQDKLNFSNIFFYIETSLKNTDRIKDINIFINLAMGHGFIIKKYKTDSSVLYLFSCTKLQYDLLINDYEKNYELAYNKTIKSLISAANRNYIVSDYSLDGVCVDGTNPIQLENFKDYDPEETSLNLLLEKYDIRKEELLKFLIIFTNDPEEKCLYIESIESYKYRYDNDLLDTWEEELIRMISEKDPGALVIPSISDKNIFEINLNSNPSDESIYDEIDEIL